MRRRKRLGVFGGDDVGGAADGPEEGFDGEDDEADAGEVLEVVGDEGVDHGVIVDEAEGWEEDAGEEEHGGEGAAGDFFAEGPEGGEDGDVGAGGDPEPGGGGLAGGDGEAGVDLDDGVGPEEFAEIEGEGVGGDQKSLGE